VSPHAPDEALFTEVPRSGILRSPFAGSCIDRPPRGVRMASKALHAAWRSTLVVVDGYAGRRMLRCCRSHLSHFPRTYAEGAGSSESNPAPPRPDPLRVWARIAPSFGGLWRLQTFVCVRAVSAIPHIYTSVLQAVPERGRTGRLEGAFHGYQAGAMQDLGYELPRIPIPRTRVNKGNRSRVEAVRSRTSWD